MMGEFTTSECIFLFSAGFLKLQLIQQSEVEGKKSDEY